jgi:hypothetical protein
MVRRFPWHAAFTAAPVCSYFFCLSRVSVLWIICVCILISDCVGTVVWITVTTKKYSEWNLFTQIGSVAKCWLDIYHWGAGLAMAGRIRDIGQNVMKSFQTGNISNPSCFHILCLIAFLEEAFSRNIIIVVYIDYIIIVCINNNNNNNNAVINNNYRTLQDLILLFKTPKGTRKYFFDLYRPFGHAPSESFASPVITFLQRISEILFFCFVLRARKNGLEEVMLLY